MAARCEAVPSWCDFFRPRDYRAFRTVVEACLSGSGQPMHDRGDGTIDVDGASISLGNLAQVCHAKPRSEWPSIVATHFAALRSALDDFVEPSFEEVREQLKVRLYNERGLPEPVREQLVTREVAKGLHAALVIDNPSTVVSVAAPWAAAWGRPRDELFRIALENVRAQERPQIHRMPVEGGGSLTTLVAESVFVATWLLMLEEFAGADPQHGSLVAIPNRQVLMYVPIVDTTAISTARVALELADEFYRKGPGSISPYLYWRRGSTITWLPAELRGRRAVIAPPPDFAEALAAVGYR